MAFRRGMSRWGGYGYGQGIDAGAADKLRGLLRCGKAAALLLAEFGHIAQFGLYVGAVGLCHLHRFGGYVHVLVEGFLGGVNHHRVEAFVQAPLHQLQTGAVVQVDIALQAIVFHDLAPHLVGRVQPHVVYRRARELEHHRRVHRLCGAGHAGEGFEIIKVGGQHGGAFPLAVVKDFSDSSHGFYVDSERKVIYS